MTTTDLAWTMDDLDDVDEIDDSRVCRCNYEEDEKNQKILVGSGSLAETSVLTPIPRNRSHLPIYATPHQLVPFWVLPSAFTASPR